MWIGQTGRLLVRPLWQEDLPEYHRLMSDEKTMYYLPETMTRTPEESKRRLMDAILLAGQQPPPQLHLAVQRKEDGAFMGSVGYMLVASPPAGRVVQAGYFLLPEYHGKGYCTEAFRILIAHAFEKDGVVRLNCGCYAENKASERVMQKCGLKKEGHFERAAWHDGQMRDRLAYRLLKEEWDEIKTLYL